MSQTSYHHLFLLDIALQVLCWFVVKSQPMSQSLRHLVHLKLLSLPYQDDTLAALIPDHLGECF